MEFIRLSDEPTDIAPDGSEVRKLVAGINGTMAHFRLAPGQVSMAVAHRSVEELWYVVSGSGEMVVGDGPAQPIGPAMSVRIPVGHRFQFRSIGDEPLEIVGTTMPPWPGDDEAQPAPAYWDEAGRPID